MQNESIFNNVKTSKMNKTIENTLSCTYQSTYQNTFEVNWDQITQRYQVPQVQDLYNLSTGKLNNSRNVKHLKSIQEHEADKVLVFRTAIFVHQ